MLTRRDLDLVNALAISTSQATWKMPNFTKA